MVVLEDSNGVVPLEVCAQEACRAHEKDGKCIEGFARVDCPHWAKRSAQSPMLARPSLPQVSWHRGQALETDELALVTRRFATSTVLLLGEHDSGKTTLLASIFLAFSRGRIGEFSFAGSRTILGFERRSFKACLVSGGSKAQTDHTSTQDPSYLHIMVRREADLMTSSLAITDIAGETLRELYETPKDAAVLPLAQRAERIALCVDAVRLADTVERHRLTATASQTLRSLAENGCGGYPKKVQLVLTMGDRLVHDSDSWRRVEHHLAAIASAGAGYGIEVQTIRTASRKGPGLGRESGFEELIATWCVPASLSSMSVFGVPRRAFDRFGLVGGEQ